MTYVGYATTFLSRPLGGIVLGWVADVWGRKLAVLVSIYGMILATVCQGLLPSYHCCGETAGHVGVVALVLLRLVQGFCTAGEIGTVTSYLVENVPQRSLGLTTSMT